MSPVDARAFLILLASSGKQSAAAEALGCSATAVSKRLAEARKVLGDEQALELIEKHKLNDAAGVNLRKPFILGKLDCSVCGRDRIRQPSGKLRCNHCRNDRYRAEHPLDPTLEVLPLEEVSRRFVVLLAQAGTQAAAAEVIERSQTVVSERLKKARKVLGDEEVIALLKANQKDEQCGQSLLKTFNINKPTCQRCGNPRTPLATTGALVCRHCANIRNQDYKARHPERIKAAAKDYYIRNAEAIKNKVKPPRPYNAQANRDYYAQNSERIKARVAEYREANREALNAQARAASKNPANRPRINANLARWKKRNPHKVAEDNVRRAVMIYKQRPAWANKADIQEVYALARLRTQLTGIKWVVDHIVPLHSDLVCGLHCEANLQVIPALTNAAKLNLWWPDMPDATSDCEAFFVRPSLYLTPPAAPAAFISASHLAGLPAKRTHPTTPGAHGPQFTPERNTHDSQQ